MSVEQVIEQVHRLRHGHLPVWGQESDGIGRNWFCRICREQPKRARKEGPRE